MAGSLTHPTGNHLLDSLEGGTFQRLAGRLAMEEMELRQPLAELGAPITDIWFPVTAVASLITTLDDGSSIEIATIGNEGMVGAPIALGAKAMPEREYSQVPGTAIRISADHFVEEVSRPGPLQALIYRYIQAFFVQTSQQVACNGLHSIEERASRWLLLTHDRVGTDEFILTQQFFSEMLGVRRASVTVVASVLQRAGFITFSRGRITILDREGLENTSCECYRVLRDEFDRMLG